MADMDLAVFACVFSNWVLAATELIRPFCPLIWSEIATIVDDCAIADWVFEL